MKVSCHWLKAYTPHPLTPSELSHALTMCGLEVEEEISLEITTAGIVVGHILDCARHPNADRLTVCQVDVGSEAPVQILCGAPNAAIGQKVAVATEGTTLRLPGKSKPIRIRKSQIRGEWSAGMICAEDELGISDDHSGIMVLHPEAIPGTPFAAYLGDAGLPAQDLVLDINITPNRPDATCHIGVARDVSTLCNVPLMRPEIAMPIPGGDAARDVSVDIQCPDLCRRYVAMVVHNVTIGPSPRWLQQRLQSIGLRPINNVVDITNFVMYECGQPLHAFDYDELAGRKIIVRESTAGEVLTTLDGKDRELPRGTVLICDAKRAVAIGGIMGAENSEVTDATVNVLIESAYFDPATTRRSARALGLSTDASYRFERGVDASGQVWAAARAAELMTQLAGGTVVSGHVDAHPKPVTMPTVTLRHSRISRILGTEIPEADVERILSTLGFEMGICVPGTWQWKVPPYRPDVSLEVDLVEEVARIYGYNNIPLPSGTHLQGKAPRSRPADTLRSDAYGLLGGRGYREIYTNSLLSRADAEQFCSPALGARGPAVETLNAVSQSMTTLRPSLLPGVLAVMKHNQNHGQEVLRFYEFGHVFHRVKDMVAYIPGFSEYDALIMAISGPLGPAEWGTRSRAADFFDLKGDVETLLTTLRVPKVTMHPSHEPTSLTRYHVVIRSGNTEIGYMGQLRQEISTAKDIKAPVFFAEFNWTRLVLSADRNAARRYTPVSRYPVVTRDLSLMVDRSIPTGQMEHTIRAAGKPLLSDVTVFDIYSDKEHSPSQQSIAFSLRFAAQRTLRDKEVDRMVKKIVDALHRQHKATLRGHTETAVA